MKRIKAKLLTVLLLCSTILCMAPSGTAGIFEAEAATKLEAPVPYVCDTYSVTWDRVPNAGSYEVKLTLSNRDFGKTVTRTVTTTLNTLDLTLFAAGCEVSVSVRAVPSAAKKKNYSSSDWEGCDDVIVPAEGNTVSGYAGVSGSKFYLEDDSGHRLSGWQRVNRFWYYFDPAASNLTAIGWKAIGGDTYYFEESGKMHTGWQAYDYKWYFLDSSGGKMVTGWHQTAPNKQFYFTENATADHPRGSLDIDVTHATYPNNNPPYELVQSTASSGTSTPGSSAAQTAGSVNEWRTNPDGSWSYTKNGKPVKSTWENIGGFWYYFNANGIMLTGWQYINSRWYYLEPNPNGSNGYKYGAMWANATTPDGYTVNGDGMWVKDGQVVTERGNTQPAASSGSTTTVERLITDCRITVSAADAGAGKCRTAKVTGATGCTVTEQSYSKPYEEWIAGVSITITVKLQTNAGYKFGSGTSYTCSGAKIASQSGTASSRTVNLTYTPVMKLEAPSLIYITENNELKWVPAAHGKRYKVQIAGGDTGSTVTKTVSEPSIDLMEYGDIDSSVMNATISSLGAEGNSSYIESDKVVINDLGSYKATHQINGTLDYVDGKLRYRDVNGTAVSGWQQLLGNWYHFKKSGYADGPGWYQDESGYWYYFAKDYRMLTGTITENGKTYFLNDGSRQNIPLGAWVQ